jgi:hypothetical protein
MSGIREVGWWRWPLWSWRNLAVTVMAAAMLVVGLGRVSGGSEHVAPGGRALEVGGTVSGASTPSPPASAAPASPAPSVSPAALESPEDVAVAFVGMWARPDAEVEEWRANCKALSTPRFATILDAASSAAVPASRVVGKTEVLERSAVSARVRVPTDGGAVHVALERIAGGWQVDGIEPEELIVASASRG